ncbi:MAG: response regulator [Nitrospirae bacterium]|nr:response regulator [Nitrospirota bacterium]
MIRNGAADILIVDDEPDICWALTHILKGMGIVPVTTTSGREALRLARSQRFALAFVDAKLPDLDGLDLARRIREGDAAVRIVLVSGYFYRDDAEVRQAMAAGLITDFVSKPIPHEEIQAIASGVVSR